MQLVKLKFNKSFLSLSFIIPFLFAVNSGFHIKGVPTYLTMYITFYIALIYTILKIIKSKTIKIPISAVLAFSLILYFLTTLFQNGEILVTLAACVTFLFYIIGILLFKKLSFIQMQVISKCIFGYNIILYTIDCFYRFSQANLSQLLKNFYLYKTNCLLYFDTNALAINSTVLTFFAYYMFKKTKQKFYMYISFIFALFTFLSFSRAAIIATLISFLVFILYDSIKNLLLFKNTDFSKLPISYIKNITFVVLSVFISIPCVLQFISFITNDGSFVTKIEIFKDTINFIENSNFIQIFLGVGFDNAITVLNRYAHNYLATYAVETGFIGYILITAFLLRILYETPKTIYILLPFFIFGISYIGHTILNLFYIVLAIIWSIEHPENKFLQTKNNIKITKGLL